jgi:hypothetical protein
MCCTSSSQVLVLVLYLLVVVRYKYLCLYIVSACGVMGREIESCQGIHRVVFLEKKKGK